MSSIFCLKWGFFPKKALKKEKIRGRFSSKQGKHRVCTIKQYIATRTEHAIPHGILSFVRPLIEKKKSPRILNLLNL
jgi:hypothetical protein